MINPMLLSCLGDFGKCSVRTRQDRDAGFGVHRHCACAGRARTCERCGCDSAFGERQRRTRTSCVFHRSLLRFFERMAVPLDPSRSAEAEFKSCGGECVASPERRDQLHSRRDCSFPCILFPGSALHRPGGGDSRFIFYFPCRLEDCEADSA